MKRNILLAALLSFPFVMSHAQQGDTMTDPIIVGTISSSITYQDTRNTNNYTNQYSGRSTKDVFYQFTLTDPATVTMTHEGSSFADTYMHLLDASGTCIAYNDDYSGEGHCSDTHMAYIRMQLEAGTYYIVSEGYSKNGNITTNITTVIQSAVIGDFKFLPIIIESHSNDFSYTETVNTHRYTNQYTGQTTRDVYHLFTLNKTMSVTITHDGSTLQDTYMTLLDSNGNLIESNNDYDGPSHCQDTHQAFIQKQLSAGTYYVVSEGNTTDGIIKVNITGNTSSDYGYTTIPSTYSTNPSTSVGTMGGRFAVSPMGGATYSIPIEVPVGVGGLQPQLSIVYNSQARNSLVGYGVNIVGFSSITRGAKNLYHDNISRGTTYHDDDALFLNGVRLILASGTEGQNGAIYNPESDPYTNVITHKGDASSSELWFEVQCSDGMVYYYTTVLSYSSNGTQKILSWHLSRAIQPTGNYIDYSYYKICSQDQSNLHLYPRMISYGKNINDPSSLLSNIIEFSYETRTDKIPIRFDGKYGIMDKRLKSITCRTNDVVFRTYTFRYNTAGDGSGTQYSRLISIIESNNYNDSLTTFFSWSYLPSPSNNATNITVNPPANIPAEITLDYDNQAFFSGDVNGDGFDDLISLTPATSVKNEWTRYFNILNFHYSSLNQGNIEFNTSDSIGDYFEVDWLGSFVGMTNKLKGEMITDFDGDGINECILPVFIESEPKYRDKIRIQILGRNICDSQDWELEAKGEPLTTTADINNDGKGDLVVLESAPYDLYYRLRIYQFKDNYVPGKHLVCKYSQAKLSLASKPKKLYATDMNGNGATDLLVVFSNGYSIYWNNGNCLFGQSSRTDGTDCLLDDMCEVGDFDGDGLMDFLTNEWGSHTWYFHLNNGDGTFNRIPAMTFNLGDQEFTSKDDDKFHFEVLDFDSDGKSDVVITKANYSHESNWLGQEWGEFDKTHTYWMKSTGTCLIEVCHASSNKAYDAYQFRFNIGDFDGDGRTELINNGYDCAHALNSNASPSWHMYKTINLSTQSGKVISITDNLGSKTDISYGVLTDPNIYSLTEKGHYPTLNVITPLNVVKQIIEDNGAAGSQTTQYTYENLKVHLRGKGLMGFTKMDANNTTMGIKDENGVSQWDDNYFIPLVTYTKHIIGSLTTLTTTTYSITQKNGKQYYAYPSQTIEKDMDNNIVTTTRSYDSTYGYLTYETISYGTNMYCSVCYTDYVNKGLSYKPQTIITSKRHPDDTNIFTNTVYYNYDDNGLIITKIQNSDSSKPLTTNYTYDLWGNVTSMSCTGIGVPLFTTLYNYDGDTHRFPIRIYTNPTSSVRKYTYDLWGNTLTECDSVNSDVCNITEHTYDGWGNNIRTQIPGYGSVSYTRGWGSDAEKQFFILEQGSARPWIKKWFDNKGREVLVESIGAKDVIVKKKTTYNTKGLVTSVAKTKGLITILNNYTYDNRGRVLTENSNSGTSTRFQYGNLYVRTISNNRTTYKRYDVMGNIKEIVDPVSKVCYFYSSNGNVKRIETDGVIYQYTYDEIGNKTSYSDPDAGITTYTYDAMGRETTRTDSRNIMFTIDYDVYGRIISETAGNETITYSYGSSGNGQMRLIGKTLGNISDTYEYDQYGRIVSQYKGGHTTNYLYNSIGQLSRKTWADIDNSKYVDYYYDTYGNHIGSNAISGEVEWNLSQYTGTTVSSTIKLHSNSTLFTRTNTTDDYGFPSDYSLSLGDAVLNSEAYTYDYRTGNLIQCIKSNGIEKYAYDSVNRLTLMTENDNEVMNVSYAPNGNITNKTNIGTYSYNSSKKHEITSVDNDHNVIAYNNQNIKYNAWGKVYEVNETIGNDTYKYELTYGPDLQRVMTVLWKNDSLVHSVTYGDEFEEKYQDGEITHYYYINGGDGNCAVYTSNTQLGDKAYCIDHDHLGSITRLYDQNGTKCFAATYDPWGRRVVDAGSIEFDRGYTGHEHIDELPLIDMNGRMYDPLLGRFISIDKYIQSPYCSQGFNPYAYCMNNPLKYTDPDGEFSILLACLIASASSALIDYGIQVAFNLCHGLRGQDAFLNKVDFFDVGISAIMGACNVGLASIGSVGKIGKLALNIGSIVLTSAIDITGEGIQDVSADDILFRSIIGVATYAASDAIGDIVTQKLKARNAPQTESRPQPEPQVETKVQNPINAGEDYPPNQGAVSGTEMEVWLERGQKIDRYGEASEKSHYLSPVGTDYPSRSLNLQGDVSLEIYEVEKPFVAESSVILPWYNQPGMGYQYNTFIPIKELLHKGYLKKIDTIIIRF